MNAVAHDLAARNAVAWTFAKNDPTAVADAAMVSAAVTKSLATWPDVGPRRQPWMTLTPQERAVEMEAFRLVEEREPQTWRAMVLRHLLFQRRATPATINAIANFYGRENDYDSAQNAAAVCSHLAKLPQSPDSDSGLALLTRVVENMPQPVPDDLDSQGRPRDTGILPSGLLPTAPRVLCISVRDRGDAGLLLPGQTSADPDLPLLPFDGEATGAPLLRLVDAAGVGGMQPGRGAHPLPDDSASAFVTDPPYYDAVPYAYLSDFFYVWLRRTLGSTFPALFPGESVPKDEEIVVDRPHELSTSTKDSAFYEANLQRAFADGRRVLMPEGIGTIVFASKTTASWEAILQAMIDAGWVITASWPIDTEMASKVAAIGQARLMSSVHLVCRPRENPDGSLREDTVGDWRAVLRELPERIHAWMPRLAKEGVGGADAIFACLGPALEIFSRYSRVEKASGERVELREYLEQVWAVVAREALSMIFEDADATGLEEDARLTAMWLWTLSTNTNGGNGASSAGADGDGEEESAPKGRAGAGFTLEFDAARKIAQGLGAHLEDLGPVVEVKGDQARLLSVAERTRHLFGKDQAQRAPVRRAKKVKQLILFEELDAAEKDAGWGDLGLPPLGETTLDRVHQAMVLFAAGRSEALKRFLVEEGIGRGTRFWKLAQSLSVLYPTNTDEKRWVDGVLARKKGLGF